VKNQIRQIAIACILGYILVVASAVAVSIIIGLVTGYFPSLALFTLVLLTFGFVWLHPIFLAVPPVLAFSMMVFLSKTSINKRVAAGAGIASYYILIELIYLISGTGDFPIEVAIPWIFWVFILGYASSVMVDKLEL